MRIRVRLLTNFREEMGWTPYQRGVQQKVGSFTREVSFSPGHPNTPNYGIGTLGVNFVIHGEQGSIEFSWSTGIVPETGNRVIEPRKEWDLTRVDPLASLFGPMNLEPYTVVEWGHNAPSGTRIIYHSVIQKGSTEEGFVCDYLESGRCFSDSSYLLADEFFATFMNKGEGAVWQALEALYVQYYKAADA
jgi:hypothetical protein